MSLNSGFKTNRFLEDAIARGTLKWEREKPASREGLDPTLIRAYTLEKEVVRIEIPADAKIELHKNENPNDTYWDVQFAGVHVYCYNFEPMVGTMISVLAELCVRTWEPVGGSERTDGKTCYRNYELFVDAYFTQNTAKCDLIVYATQDKEYGNGIEVGRRYPDMMGDSGHYCHVSGDRKRNYHFQFVAQRKPHRKPVMAEALAKAGVS